MNSEKNKETNTLFSAVVGGQHLLELTTFLFPPPPKKNYYRFILLVGFCLIPAETWKPQLYGSQYDLLYI